MFEQDISTKENVFVYVFFSCNIYSKYILKLIVNTPRLNWGGMKYSYDYPSSLASIFVRNKDTPSLSVHPKKFVSGKYDKTNK